MRIPSAFEEEDRGKLFDFVEAYSFGRLAPLQRGEPFASYLPFLLERGAGPIFSWKRGHGLRNVTCVVGIGRERRPASPPSPLSGDLPDEPPSSISRRHR